MQPQSPSDSTPITKMLDFLSNPALYPQAPASIQIIQTHASIVALGDDFAYKLKKPVNFGFLDFSTLPKRHFYCQEEVRLNQRLSAGIYKGVLPIYEKEGQLQFEASDSLVDYVVSMKKLEESNFLIELIRYPDFSPEDLRPLVEKLFKFYQAQIPSKNVNQWAEPDKIRETILSNCQSAQENIGFCLDPLTFELVSSDQLQFLEQHKALFWDRIKAGNVVDGHGDIRSEHIVRVEGDAFDLYDCIEFNEAFRCLDRLNDLAFLLMDLEYRHRYDLSEGILSHWQTLLGKTEPLGLLHFYKTYRAWVRAKVNALKAQEEEIAPELRAKALQKAKAYYQLGLRYTLLGSEPTILLVMGGVATGKSTLARQLAEYFQAYHVNSDVLRKKMAGKPLLERTEAKENQDVYSQKNTDKVYQRLEIEGISITSFQGVIVLDATYQNENHFRSLLEHTQREGITLKVILTQAPEAVVISRLKAREGKPLVSDMRLDVYDPKQHHLDYPLDDYPVSIYRVDTTYPLHENIETLCRTWLQEKN